MRTRQERIAAAKIKLAEIDPKFRTLEEQFKEATRELNDAELSFDIGERVSVRETCNRGCCVERQFEGIVTAQERDGYSYTVETEDRVYTDVWYNDMKRLSPAMQAVVQDTCMCTSLVHDEGCKER